MNKQKVFNCFMVPPSGKAKLIPKKTFNPHGVALSLENLIYKHSIPTGLIVENIVIVKIILICAAVWAFFSLLDSPSGKSEANP